MMFFLMNGFISGALLIGGVIGVFTGGINLAPAVLILVLASLLFGAAFGICITDERDSR